MHQLNKIQLIYALQKYYAIQKKRGVMVNYIYKQIIQLYPMSIVTFYAYMGTATFPYMKKLDNSKLQKFTENVITSLQRITDEA